VLGVELGYNHMISMEMAAADTELRQFTTSDGFANSVTLTGQSSLEPIDYAVTASMDASGTPAVRQRSDRIPRHPVRE